MKRRVSHSFAIISLALGCVVATIQFAAAGPEVVPASECRVTALIEADLVVLPPGTPATDAVDTSGGVPADDETVVAVTATIRESIACANANDPMRSLALFSPSYLQWRFSGERQDDLGHLIASLSRTPGPVAEADLLALDSISEVTTLSDGRVIATVVTSNATEAFTDKLILTDASGGWLIDQVVLGASASTPEATG